MTVKLPWFFKISSNIIKSKSQLPIFSLINKLTLSSLVIGIALIFVGLSIVNFFEQQFKDNYLKLIPQARIETVKDQLLNDPQTIINNLTQLDEVAQATSYLEIAALIKGETSNALINILGVKQDYIKMLNLDKLLVAGHFPNDPEKLQLVLGQSLSKRFALKLGDKLNLVLIDGSKQIYGQFELVGIVNSNTELDQFIALTQQSLLNQLLDKAPDSTNVIQLTMVDPLKVNSDLALYSPQLYNQIVRVSYWKNTYQFIYQDIQLIRQIFYILLGFMLLLSAFNISSSIFVLVKDKRSTIATLQVLGASQASIVKIFILSSLIIATKSLCYGLLIGLLINLGLSSFLELLDSIGIHLFKQIYFISRLDSLMQWSDLLLIVSAVIVVSLLAAIIPSLLASRQNIVMTLNQSK